VKVGVVTFVRLSPGVPLSLAGASVGAAGVAGATVSIVTDVAGDGALVFPAASVAVTVTA
jgi:hypothetical protein